MAASPAARHAPGAVRALLIRLLLVQMRLALTQQAPDCFSWRYLCAPRLGLGVCDLSVCLAGGCRDRLGAGMAASARDSAAAAAGRYLVDEHDGGASDQEMDVEVEDEYHDHAQDADRRDGGADGDDDYSLVGTTFICAV